MSVGDDGSDWRGVGEMACCRMQKMAKCHCSTPKPWTPPKPYIPGAHHQIPIPINPWTPTPTPTLSFNNKSSTWSNSFQNAVGGDYVTYQGYTMVLTHNGSLRIINGNDPQGKDIYWSFESCQQNGTATSGWESSSKTSTTNTGRYVIRLNNKPIWSAPPMNEPEATIYNSSSRVGYTYLVFYGTNAELLEYNEINPFDQLTTGNSQVAWQSGTGSNSC